MKRPESWKSSIRTSTKRPTGNFMLVLNIEHLNERKKIFWMLIKCINLGTIQFNGWWLLSAVYAVLLYAVHCTLYTLAIYIKISNRRRSFTFHEEIENVFSFFVVFHFCLLLHLSAETTLPLEFNRKMLLWLLPIGMEWWHLSYLAVAGNLNSVTEYFENMHFIESFTIYNARTKATKDDHDHSVY